mmetsp:Transcript_6144/g.17609  ORF Transcript_6144/g.17609 Transcript_6144/m.17609 type:complete len:221 (-) Transcript_6144:1193-1855(-)
MRVNEWSLSATHAQVKKLRDPHHHHSVTRICPHTHRSGLTRTCTATHSHALDALTHRRWYKQIMAFLAIARSIPLSLPRLKPDTHVCGSLHFSRKQSNQPRRAYRQAGREAGRGSHPQPTMDPPRMTSRHRHAVSCVHGLACRTEAHSPCASGAADKTVDEGTTRATACVMVRMCTHQSNHPPLERHEILSPQPLTHYRSTPHQPPSPSLPPHTLRRSLP